MLPLLLASFALASNETDLPPAPEERPAPPVHGSAFWVGVTAPMASVPLLTSSPLGVSLDGDVRFASRLAWLQPELRVAALRDVALDADPLGYDTLVQATLGARFGVDTGVYGGINGGVAAAWTLAPGQEAVRFTPAYTGFVGYAFPLGDHTRLSPELTLGTINTLTVRVEWGG